MSPFVWVNRPPPAGVKLELKKGRPEAAFQLMRTESGKSQFATGYCNADISNCMDCI